MTFRLENENVPMRIESTRACDGSFLEGKVGLS
jgi:hypothetical protein